MSRRRLQLGDRVRLSAWTAAADAPQTRGTVVGFGHRQEAKRGLMDEVFLVALDEGAYLHGRGPEGNAWPYVSVLVVHPSAVELEPAPEPSSNFPAWPERAS